ncbi:MAG: 16S rRNA (guanine(966)-N(2))-methyltransferase RsmD [Parvularculales bacterium]
MRLTGGRLAGRPVKAPRGKHIRPTRDQARESLFNVLAHGLIDDFTPCSVLDLFAGTGLLGLEALSRGATFALFVEQDKTACSLIEENLARLSLLDSAHVLRRDASRLRTLPDRIAPTEGFHLVFCDPPWRRNLGYRALSAIHKGGCLSPNAVCVLEEAAHVALDPPPEFELIDRRVQGTTQFLLMRPS